MKKTYKPGQIITIVENYPSIPRGMRFVTQFRVCKADPTVGISCLYCDLWLRDMIHCCKYCGRSHNDWDKNPQGYILKRIRHENR